MSPFTVFVLCIQACLIQSAFGQGCGTCGGSRVVSLGKIRQPAISLSKASSYQASSIAGSSSGYGGQGTGQVAAAGDIAATGNTCVTGAVPVIGSVSFGGKVPASGSVCVSGQCGCGCTK